MNAIRMGSPNFSGLVARTEKHRIFGLQPQRFGAFIVFAETAKITFDFVLEFLADFPLGVLAGLAHCAHDRPTAKSAGICQK